MDALMLDGNAVAGLLQEVFAVEMTTALETCDGCGATEPVGAVHVYRGAVLLCRVKQGTLRPGQRMRLMHSAKEHEVEEVGLLRLKRVRTEQLSAGDVGYVIAGIKEIDGAPVGDTFTSADKPSNSPLPGFKHGTDFGSRGSVVGDTELPVRIKLR